MTQTQSNTETVQRDRDAEPPPQSREPGDAAVSGLDPGRVREVDALVDTAATAARAFRELDQEQVDAIVAAMVRAGVRAAPELAQLAIEETGFGVPSLSQPT